MSLARRQLSLNPGTGAAFAPPSKTVIPVLLFSTPSPQTHRWDTMYPFQFHIAVRLAIASKKK
jgi:hypothetical protein